MTQPDENIVHHVYVGTEYLGIYGQRRYIGNQLLEHLLRRDDGTPMSLQDAMAVHPHYTLMLAAMNSRVRDIVEKEKRSETERTVFLSYRWESNTLKTWVATLARNLRRHGFRVLLDQDADMTDGLLGPANFMAEMATAHCALLILSENYANTIPIQGINSIGFALDEQVLAKRLQDAGRLKIMGVLKEKNGRPDLCRAENTIDVRGNDQPWDLIAGKICGLLK